MNSIHEELKAVSQFLSEYATCLMASGVHTSRIVRNTARIAESFGFEAHMTLFHKTIIMTLRNKENTHVYSMVNTAKAGAINFEINSDLSALSWEAYDNHLPLDQLWEKYHAITSKPRLNAWLVWVLVGFANASFCRLFSGDWIAVAAVFVATLVGFRIKQVLGKHHINHYFIFTISAFVASLIATVTMWQQWGNTPDIAIGASVLYLIPGVPLINGIIDIIEGHVLAGTARLINAFLLIICIAFGMSLPRPGPSFPAVPGVCFSPGRMLFCRLLRTADYTAPCTPILKRNGRTLPEEGRYAASPVRAHGRASARRSGSGRRHRLTTFFTNCL